MRESFLLVAKRARWPGSVTIAAHASLRFAVVQERELVIQGLADIAIELLKGADVIPTKWGVALDLRWRRPDYAAFGNRRWSRGAACGANSETEDQQVF